MSEETKQKIRDTKRLNPVKRPNNKISEETKEKIRQTLLKYNAEKRLRND